MSSSLSQSFSSDMNTVDTYRLISSSSLRQTGSIQTVRAWPFSYNKHTLRCMENKLLCKNTYVVCYCCTVPVHEERPCMLFFFISFLLFREITKWCHISLPPMNYLRFILGSNIVKGRGMLVSVISRLDSDTKQHLYCWTIYDTHRLVYQNENKISNMSVRESLFYEPDEKLQVDFVLCAAYSSHRNVFSGCESLSLPAADMRCKSAEREIICHANTTWHQSKPV